jgi:hypothetical protein
MVEIRVTVTDPRLAPALLLRLRRLFDAPSVTYDLASSQVRVCSEWQSRAVLEVVEAVQGWMAEGDAGSTKLAVGDRSYVFASASNGP